jgi:hypothetical protein
MRKLIHILCFLIGLSAHLCQAQINLVPNPSFEDTINMHPGCRQNPHGCFLDEFIVGWRGLPLYYSEIFPQSIEPLGISNSRGVPSNCVGWQYAHSGIAYVSVTTYSLNVNALSARYYVQCKLIQKLEAGRKYKAEFFVSRADSLRMSNNSIGAYFSPDSFSVQSWGLIDVMPQIQNNPNNSLNNDSGWVLIRDTMVADGTEQYLTIGNFLPDSLSDTLSIGGPCTIPGGPTICSSLYYIDDVSVTLIDETGIEEMLHESAIKLYPNPARDVLRIEMQNQFAGTITVTDALGKVFYQNSTEKSISHFSIDLREFPAGLYFVSFRNEGGDVNKRFVKN